MSYTLQNRLQWQPKSPKAKAATLDAIIGNADHYVVPASEVKESFVSEVTTNVKSLQSIVNSMTRSADPVFTSAALSYFSEALIIAVGIAACQRLIDQPELCTSDESYIRRVISTALIVKLGDTPDTSMHL
jgi:hypothetical protein